MRVSFGAHGHLVMNEVPVLFGPRRAHFSQTAPSPSPSLALGTIDFGKPRPQPWLPGSRVSPAARAASPEAYWVAGESSTVVEVGCGMLPPNDGRSGFSMLTATPS